ncbi:SDR family NAD(P)-dependent oxidoreductase [Pectobacterium punjabense]|uniref:SDR family NAD(P)-dependent oxidoreductase n=1 Tax=Pectobacterium punjabense TaxID=2108399 RepID=UPI0024051941|nr:SDR family oxidoreductase [Pectobacterium punjabense]MDG0798418.1 SDR family NAD(P)-dependent oxidoreductase [Pectobacterium punjabense]
MSANFNNKVALVTGGGSGIGRTIAKHLAVHGCHVVILGRNIDALKESAKQNSLIDYIKADISISADVSRVLRDIKNRFGRLDILVNNAGVAPVTSLAELDIAEFDRVFNVNVRGVIDLTQQSLPLLKRYKGNVVNISSAVANNPLPTMSVYSSSKAALNTLTRVWAKELASDGIRVNSVSVGPIETPIYEKSGLSEEEKKQHIAAVQRIVPLGRFGTAQDVAYVVSFLASEEASFVTGSDYAVDGGFAA